MHPDHLPHIDKAPGSSDDTFLLQQAAEGNGDAYARLFEKYLPRLSNFLFLFTGGSSVDTEDIIQEIFLKIWEKRETLMLIQSFDRYLFRIARTKAIDLLRHRGAVRRFEINYTALKETATPGSDVEDALQYEQYRTTAKMAIDSLTPALREAFLLSTEEDLSLDEIAQKLSISKDAVKKRLYTANVSIKNYLREQGEWLGMMSFLLALWTKS